MLWQRVVTAVVLLLVLLRPLHLQVHLEQALPCPKS
jgi:threonine/homoserine efflux transporter RhtA